MKPKSSKLTKVSFLRWAARLQLPQLAISLILRIRSLPPSRRTQGRFSVRGSYPSVKSGECIQFESHRNEFPPVIEFEHDPDVLEFYDQPGKIKLNYPDKSGSNTGCLHTPDFFVMRKDSAGWVECKTEEKLRELKEDAPHRYVRNADGTWRCPPGETFAAQYGLTYRLRSSRENSSELTRNLTFLDDYFRRDYPAPADKLVRSVLDAVRRSQGITYRELIAKLRGLSADDLNYLISRNVVYTDLRSVLLVDPETVTLFTDITVAQSIAATAKSHATPITENAGPVELVPAAKLRIDDCEYIITEVTDYLVHLLSTEGKVSHWKRVDLEQHILAGKVSACASPDARQRQVLGKIVSANEEDLRLAVKRWHAIQPYLLPPGTKCGVRKPRDRSERRWLMAYRLAEQNLGNGFIGLLPRPLLGNPGCKLVDEVKPLVERYITSVFETEKNCTISHVHRLLQKECEEKGLTSPSMRSFAEHVRARPQYEQTKKRKGPRSATAKKKKFHFYLDMTTPIHGDRPWEIGHIDHTELDIELVCSRTGKNLGRPWLTILTDAFSRRILAISLSFAPPSTEACMRILRNCVKRHHRLPQTMVVDNGAEFNSIYFESLLAAYIITKKSRPPAHPRFGSVCERLFGTINKQFVHNLTGNTQLTKNVRTLTKSVDPKNHAAWTLEELTKLLAAYCFEVYDTTSHPALGQSPREACLQGLEKSGQRQHTFIVYDSVFNILTLPTTRAGVAKLHPQKGVHINYFDYWSDAFLDPKLEGENIPIRFDPWDASIAHAFVDHQWVPCISNYARDFKHRSIHSIDAASAELRKERRLHAKNRSITGRQLAKFMADVAEREDILIEQARERASRDAYGLLQGEVTSGEEQPLPNNVTPFRPDADSQLNNGTDGVTADDDHSACPVREE